MPAALPRSVFLLLLVAVVHSLDDDQYCNVTMHKDNVYDVSNTHIHTINHTALHIIPTDPSKYLICVNMSYNSITTLDNETFVNQWNVRSLDLSHNLITELPIGFLNPLRRLEFLYLNDNRVLALPGDIFQNLYFIEFVDFSNNIISDIPIQVFNHTMPWLEKVLFTNNSLTSYEAFSYVYPNVTNRYLDLQWNNISTFTNAYGVSIKRDEQKTVYLQVIQDLRHNQLRRWDNNLLLQYFDNSSGVTLEKAIGLMLINVNDNPWICDCTMYSFISEFRDSFLKYTQDDQVMIKCYDPPRYRGKNILFDLQPKDFVCEVTKDCPEHCQCLNIPEEQILKVDCTNNALRNVPDTLPVSPYGNIELKINDNKISSLTNVSYAKHIVKLSIRNNALKHIESIFIEAIASKDNVNMSLDFKDNQLTSLPKSMHKIKYQYVSLFGNQFVCSCDMLWMVDWINLAPVTAYKEISCTYKGDTYMITELNNDILECINKGSIILVITLACVVAVVIAIGITVKRCPYETKVLLYKIFRIHPADKYVVDKTEDKNYDLYVCYDEEDPYLRQWVKRVLVRQLEEKKPFYKLCLSGRNLKAGNEADSRLDLMEQSKRMLIILSEGIEDNDWCTFEASQSECLDDIEGRIVYMLYDDAAKTLVCQETWKSRVSGRKCFIVGERMMWSKLRYELPQKSKRFW